jgi:hypothetical protein
MYSAAQEQFGNNPFAQLFAGNGGTEEFFFVFFYHFFSLFFL